MWVGYFEIQGEIILIWINNTVETRYNDLNLGVGLFYTNMMKSVQKKLNFRYTT